MAVYFALTLIFSSSVLIGLYIVAIVNWCAKKENKLLSVIGVVVSVLLFITTCLSPMWISDLASDMANNAVINIDECEYIGAEVYTVGNNRTVFIDITSGDGALYAYNKRVDPTAQYMLVLDAKTGEVLVVWQNVN